MCDVSWVKLTVTGDTTDSSAGPDSWARQDGVGAWFKKDAWDTPEMSDTLPTIDDTPEASPRPNQGPVNAADDAGPDVAQGLVKTSDHLIIIIILVFLLFLF